MPTENEPTSCLVECYWPGVTEEKVAAALARIQAALQRRRPQGRGPRLLGSIFVPVDETVFCLFDGERAEVEALSAAAELPFERILGSRWIDATRRSGNEIDT
jgi:hypothetical protein